MAETEIQQGHLIDYERRETWPDTWPNDLDVLVCPECGWAARVRGLDCGGGNYLLQFVHGMRWQGDAWMIQEACLIEHDFGKRENVHALIAGLRRFRPYHPEVFHHESKGGRGNCSLSMCQNPPRWMRDSKTADGRAQYWAYCRSCAQRAAKDVFKAAT